ncbi:WD domain, G-beta repeat family protein [Aspergillus niger]|uniref:WD domain, G-beta repeat family protein n=1 Tax=Aspergillus niger TaxID=5061 RepID=A0A505HTY2_ASPNG|nr:WD domain, G-beta repeat family protein [Aspergillus niger]
MSDSVDRVFVHALNTVKRIPRTGTARPPASERLKLYGLYKQSMEGDVEGVMDRPVGNTADVFMECEKWDAWHAQRGLSRTEAKRRYISTLIETMHNYASQTAEARELVAELEFVWDQIKSNPSSSSMSSSQEPGSPVASAAVSMRDHARLQPQSSNRLTRPEYEQLLANTARGRGSERLRVLSPEEYDHDHHHHDTLSRRRPPPPPDDSKRWRRTVEQALTTMTAEIAAVREQLEARALAHRRRTGLWAWLKWLVWVAARQIMVDLALLGMLLIWMRLRGDRRLEEKLKG